MSTETTAMTLDEALRVAELLSPMPAVARQALQRLVSAFAAATDTAERYQADYVSALGLVADVRRAAGDPEGRLMQDELIAHIAAQREDSARIDWLHANHVAATMGRDCGWVTLGLDRDSIDKARAA